MQYILLLIILTLSSCKSENKSPKVHEYPGPPPISLLDQDRDGISDPFELAQNSSVKVANFPIFRAKDIPNTQISLTQKDNPDKSFEWKNSLDKVFNVNFRQTRSKLAKLTFQRDFELQQISSSLAFSPLASFQLTNLEEYDWRRFQNLKMNENTSFYFNSSFELEASLPAAITKLTDIEAQLGYFNDGQFIALTNEFELKDEVGRNIELTDSSSRVQIQLVISNKEVFTTHKQIILKIKDYKAFTKENSTYQFLTQWSYATEILNPFLVTKPEGDQVYLIKKDLSLEQVLSEISTSFEVSGNKVMRVDHFLNERTSQKRLLNMTNQELLEKNWYYFKNNQSQSIAYLSNLEIAQSAQVLISKEVKSFSKKPQMKLELKVGETLKLNFKGSIEVPRQSTQVRTLSKVEYQEYDYFSPSSCTPRPGASCIGHRELEPREPIRRLVTRQTHCDYENQYITYEKIPLNESSLHFKTENELLSLKELSQELKTKAMNTESGIELELLITSDFIQNHGSTLKIQINDFRDQDQFELGSTSISCQDELPRDFNYHSTFGELKLEEISQKAFINLDLVRRF